MSVMRTLRGIVLLDAVLAVGLPLTHWFGTTVSAVATQLVPVGSNFDLSTGLTTQRRSPSLAFNSVGKEYMVVWNDARNPAINPHDVFGQRVSANGALLGANIPIDDSPTNQVEPTVAHNSVNNEYLVVWNARQPDGSGVARGQRISDAGTLLGSDFFVSDGRYDTSVTYGPTANEYLVTSENTSPGTRGILGQRISNSGSLLGTEIAIATTGEPDRNGHVAYNSNTNEYLTTWGTHTCIVLPVGDCNLQAQHISSSGALAGEIIVIFPFSAPAVQTALPSPAFDPTNDRYLIVFGVEILFGEIEIKGQFVSSAGQLIGANFTIAQFIPTTTRPSPTIAFSDVDDAFVVVWRENNDIVGQLLSVDGSAIGDPLVIATATASIQDPKLATNTQTGEFLVVWADDRNIPQGEQDIFGQLLGVSQPDVTPTAVPAFTRWGLILLAVTLIGLAYLKLPRRVSTAK